MKEPVRARLKLAKYRGRARKDWSTEDKAAAYTSYQLNKAREGQFSCKNNAMQPDYGATLGTGVQYLYTVRFLRESKTQVEHLKTVFAADSPQSNDIKPQRSSFEVIPGPRAEAAGQ
jgi:hypothetical protein